MIDCYNNSLIIFAVIRTHYMQGTTCLRSSKKQYARIGRIIKIGLDDLSATDRFVNFPVGNNTEFFFKHLLSGVAGVKNFIRIKTSAYEFKPIRFAIHLLIRPFLFRGFFQFFHKRRLHFPDDDRLHNSLRNSCLHTILADTPCPNPDFQD